MGKAIEPKDDVLDAEVQTWIEDAVEEMTALAEARGLEQVAEGLRAYWSVVPTGPVVSGG